MTCNHKFAKISNEELIQEITEHGDPWIQHYFFKYCFQCGLMQFKIKITNIEHVHLQNGLLLPYTEIWHDYNFGENFSTRIWKSIKNSNLIEN